MQICTATRLAPRVTDIIIIITICVRTRRLGSHAIVVGPLTDQREYDRRADVRHEYYDQTGHDGQRDGLLGVVRLFAGGRDDVESDERVETGRGSLEHLERKQRRKSN